jgi:hypothetical protein
MFGLKKRKPMKINNLPAKSVGSVSVIPTDSGQCNGVSLRTFELKDVPYSLEEAIAIDGFLGYVHDLPKKGHTMSDKPIRYDIKGRPLIVVAVCFMNPKGIKS